ncbi:MAG: hypothetical protein FWH23_01945 [Bacteroidales bacterium]|nr:hypothetical protein [Bacteroidales bacterium]
MKKTIIFPILMLFSLIAFSQTSDSLAFVQLQQNVEQLQTELRNQKSDFSKQISAANSEIDSLKKQVQNNSNAISQTTQELDVKITTAETSTNQKISEVGDSLSKTTFWVIIGLLFAVIISGIVYLLLRKKQQADKTDIVAQLSQTKQAIDEKLVNEFAKNTEALEALSKISKPTQSVEPDHSLALKVADEITLIERNISHMNKETKGLKPLIRAIERLKDNLFSKGYEMPELLEKPFVEGMKITIITSIPDENLEKGNDVITKIIKPQVNFNEKLIQMAQVEVTVGIN